MRDLFIIVEGKTELEFVNRILIPYLYIEKKFTCLIKPIQIIVKGNGHGFNNIEHFKNTIKPILHINNESVITTMIDYYGINSDTKIPDYSLCLSLVSVQEKINCLEDKLFDIVQNIKPYRYFIPNLILNEFETFLFANPQTGFSLEDDSIVNDIVQLTDNYKSIEDINNTPEGAPSKRIEAIFAKHGKKYQKGLNAVNYAELTGIEEILSKCPHFSNWLKKIELMISA